MDYNKFINYSNNTNLYIYKYSDDLDNNIKELFRDCYENWYEITNDSLKLIKEKIAKLTDNNMMMHGTLMCDRLYFKDYQKNINYYIVFRNNNIELWYIIGNVIDVIYNNSFYSIFNL